MSTVGNFPGGSAVNNLLSVQEPEIQVQSPSQEEEGVATHSSILAWRIPVARGAWQTTVHRVAKNWT